MFVLVLHILLLYQLDLIVSQTGTKNEKKKNLYHAFSSFLLSTAVQYLMIPREEVELDDVTSYNIFDNKMYKIS
jgi:hypothetical protein